MEQQTAHNKYGWLCWLCQLCQWKYSAKLPYMNYPSQTDNKPPPEVVKLQSSYAISDCAISDCAISAYLLGKHYKFKGSRILSISSKVS